MGGAISPPRQRGWCSVGPQGGASRRCRSPQPGPCRRNLSRYMGSRPKGLVGGLGEGRLARRRDLQPLARGDDGGDGGAAGFGDLAVTVAGAAADLELDEGGAAELGAILERALRSGVE